MANIDFTIEQDDLKCLFIACNYQTSFETFVIDCMKAYAEYNQRNLDNLQKYGKPKTYSQWVNGQTLSLT
jgi:hypothetical protein